MDDEYPPVPPPERHALLEDLLRQAERAVDHQAAALERLDLKTQQTLGLAVAALAGGIALLTYVGDSLAGRAGAAFVLLVGCAASCNIASLHFLVRAYVGYRAHAELAVGPTLEWLRQKGRDRTWTREELALSLLESYPAFGALNLEVMRVAAARRLVGILLLGIAVLLYAGLGIYAFKVRVMG